MNKNVKKIVKNKRLMLVCALVLIGIICLILLKGILYPNSKISYYGNRLDGIDKISFTKSDQNKIIENIKTNENVTESKLNIHGKIVNIIFNVKENVSLDDAKKIASDSLNDFSDEVKNFYDIEMIITKTDEKGTEKTKEDGTKETIKEFPIMGYKNSSSKEISW